MKKNVYDIVSTIAVLILVVSTYFAQHGGKYQYAFGIVIVLTAVGMFSMYVKALRPRNTVEQEKPIEQRRRKIQLEIPPTTIRELQHMQHTLAVGNAEDLLLAKVREQAKRAAYLVYFEKRQAGMRGFSELRESLYVGEQLKFHPHALKNPAIIIADVVEKLCPSTKEPRFEFVLAPDGTFKITPISAKRLPTGEGIRISPQTDKASDPTIH